MKLKFLQDFQGRETQNIFYKKDDVAEFEVDAALVLIQDKRAEEVSEERNPEIETESAPEIVEKKKVKK